MCLMVVVVDVSGEHPWVQKVGALGCVLSQRAR